MVPLSWMMIGAVLSQSAVADGIDERVSGDPSLRPRVEARTRLIYDAAAKSDSPRTFLLKTDNVLGVADAVGTEATGVSAGSAGARLVATVWSPQGKYAVEYYRSQEGRLLFVYETFAFFADRAPAGAWRNFMGLPAWERRSYFEDGGSIGYAVSLGKQAPAPGSGAAELQATCERLAKALGQR